MVTPLDDARIATDVENGVVGTGYYYDEYSIVEGTHEVAYTHSLEAARYAARHLIEEGGYTILAIIHPDGRLIESVVAR